MAIGLYFAPAAMNARAYDDCIKRLDAAGVVVAFDGMEIDF